MHHRGATAQERRRPADGSALRLVRDEHVRAEAPDQTGDAHDRSHVVDEAHAAHEGGLHRDAAWVERGCGERGPGVAAHHEVVLGLGQGRQHVAHAAVRPSLEVPGAQVEHPRRACAVARFAGHDHQAREAAGIGRRTGTAPVSGAQPLA